MTPTQLSRTITVLPVHDIADGCDWYKRALGIETIYLHKGETEDEPTNFAVMIRDGIQVHLILDESPDHEMPVWAKSGTGYLYLKVKDVDAMFNEVEASAVDIARGLATENWGARGFILVDPSGNAIHVEQE